MKDHDDQEHATAFTGTMHNIDAERLAILRQIIDYSIQAGESLADFKARAEAVLREPGQAAKSDLWGYGTADVWIEAGHYSDRGAELRVAFSEPLPNGYQDFWVPFSSPAGEALGWMRFSYITTTRQAALFAATQWRSASEPAPSEQARLPLPLDLLPAGFTPAKSLLERALQAQRDAPARRAAVEEAAQRRLSQVSFKVSTCTEEQGEAIRQLANTWSHRARVKFRDAKGEADLMGKRLIEHGAVCYSNCAMELQALIQAGDMSADLELQEIQEDAERP